MNHQEKVKATFCSGSNQEKHIEKGHTQVRGMGPCWWDAGSRDQLYSGDWRGPGKGQEEKQVQLRRIFLRHQIYGDPAI